LFGVIGTAFGEGSTPGTTFNVPNFGSSTAEYIIRAYDEAVILTTSDSLIAVPVGSLQLFAMNTVPTGWVRADGRELGRTAYADLFTAIGTTYGSGDGSTTFNIPNITSSGSGSPVYYIKAILSGDVEPSTVAHAASHTEGGSDVVSVTLNQVPSYQTNRNLLINGNFAVWQRGTARTILNSSKAYLPDRWGNSLFQAAAVERVALTTGAGPISQYAARVSSTTNAEISGGSRMWISQKVESANCIPYRNQQVTMSFWARFSAASVASYDNFRVEIGYFTTTTDSDTYTTNRNSSDQMFVTNGSFPTVWTKYTVTGTVPNNSNNIHVIFNMANLASTTTASEFWYEIADVQLEAGSVATPFEFEPFETTLRKCQRYYCKSFAANVAPTAGAGAAANGGNDLQIWNPTLGNSYMPFRKFPVEMRSTAIMTVLNAENTTANTWSFYTSAARSGDLNPGLSANNRGFFAQVSGTYTVTNGAWTASAEL
jgi:microcystin-dependent protein